LERRYPYQNGIYTMTDDTDSELNERIARLERTVRQQASRLEEIEGDDETLSVGRRTLLKTVGLAGLVGYGGGRVSADPKGQVGTPEDPLKALYTESIRGGVTGNTDVSSLVGSNLSISDAGELEATDTHVTVSNNIRTVEGVEDLLFGEGLDIFDDGGTVTVEADIDTSDSDTHTDVSDDGTTTVEDADDVNFGSGLDVTDDGNDTATVDVSASGSTVQADYVTLSTAKGLDNERTLNGAGGITLDNGAGSDLDVAVDGSAVAGNVLSAGTNAYEIDVSIGNGLTNNSGSLGIDSNTIDSNELASDSVTVAGNSVSLGGSTGVDHDDLSNINNDSHHTRPTAGTGLSDDSDEFNIVPGDFDGEYLSASGTTLDFDGAAEWNGGRKNTASGAYATVGGGYGGGYGNDNEASGERATVGGGDGNTASGLNATVGGGFDNTASGTYATVPGGGSGAATNDNSFVWNDGTGYHSIPNSYEGGLNSAYTVSSEPVSGNRTFSVSAQGGVRFITGSSAVTYIDGGSTGWSTTSTRSAKTNIDPVDPEAILDGVTEMEVATWEYKDDDGEGAGTRHVGPMAEDFHEVVDVGTSDDHINSINADGVALAAIQGLSKNLDETQADLEAKATRIGDQQETIDDLESEVERTTASTRWKPKTPTSASAWSPSRHRSVSGTLARKWSPMTEQRSRRSLQPTCENGQPYRRAGSR